MPSRGRKRGPRRRARPQGKQGRTGTPKKFAHASPSFLSPSLIDKRANRSRHDKHMARLLNKDAKINRKHKNSFAALLNAARDTAKEVEKQQEVKEEFQQAVEQKKALVPQPQVVEQKPFIPPPIVIPVIERTPVPRSEVRVFALANIRQLVQVVQPGSYVAFDIDETLIMTRHTPSHLLTPPGVSEFQNFVRTQFPDFTTRNKHCRALQTALNDKVTVEEDTVEVIHALQERGCRVFACTARYSELSERTEMILNSFGINFEHSSPFPNNNTMRDPETEAVIQNGIVYCNGDDKGVILRRLFATMIFKTELERLPTADVLPPPPIPGFYFLDDRVEHTASVSKSCEELKWLAVPCFTFHYRPPVSRLPIPPGKQPTPADVLLQQMKHFIEQGRVLTNQEAVAMLDDDTHSDDD